MRRTPHAFHLGLWNVAQGGVLSPSGTKKSVHGVHGVLGVLGVLGDYVGHHQHLP